jgi:translocation and assembly module TamB
MDETTKPGRHWGRKLLWVGLVCLVLVAGLTAVLRSALFHRWLGAKLVAQLEESTGGKVEIESFHTIPLRAEIDIRDLTVHGQESSGSAPLFQVKRAIVSLQVASLLSRRLGIDSLVLQSPRVHIETYPDGTTNLPAIQDSAPGRTPVQQLFDLSIAQLVVRDGELLLNEHRTPVEFEARDFEGSMTRALLRRHYDGHIRIGKVDSHIEDWRPFSWSADVQFGLTRNRLEVQRLDWSSGRERLHLSGEIRDFREPRGEGQYQASVDLADVGSILRDPRLAGGTVEIRGEIKRDVRGVSTTGKASSREIVFRNANANIRGNNASAQFSLDPLRLLVNDIQIRALGGSLSGEVSINNWLAAAPSSVGSKSAKTQNGAVRIKVDDVSGEEIANAFATPDFPVQRLHPSATVDGTIETKWVRTFDQAETALNLTLKQPETVQAGGLPVNGTVRAQYRANSGTLDVDELSLNTRSSRVTASGQLGSSGSALRLNATTTSLSEWDPMVSAFRGTKQLPFRIEGSGGFNGVLRGNVRQPAVTGHVQLADLDTVTSATDGSRQRFHWDSLACDLSASHESVSVSGCVVRRQGAEAVFNVQAGLVRGEFTPASPITGLVALNQAKVEELLALAGYHYPLTGTLQLNFHFSGSQNDPQGEGNLEVREATVYGERVRSLRSNLRLQGKWLEFYDLVLEYLQSHIDGTLAYNFDTRQFRSQLSGKEFDLGALPKLRDSRFPIDGRISFTASGSGTPEEPVMDAQVDLEDLIMNGESEGSFHLTAKTHGADMTLSGSSQMEHASLQVDGSIRLRDDWPGNLRFRLSQFDVDPILRNYLTGRVTGHSSVAGTFDLQGPMSKPREWNMTGDFDQFAAEINGIKLHNDGPVQFRVANETLHLEKLHIVGDATDLQARGTAQLTGDRALRVNTTGHVNLSLIQSFSPDLHTSGNMDVTADITGTAVDPVIRGRIAIANAGIAFDDLPLALSDTNGTLVFNQDRLEIEQLNGKSGGGTLALKGYLSYGRVREFNVSAQGEGIRLRYPPGMSSTTNADLHFTGNEGGATLSGDLTVTRFGLSQGFDFGSYVSRSRTANTLPQANSVLNKVRFDVHLTTTPELRMSTSLAKVSGEADLRLRGTMARPVLLGRADVQEGEINFNGGKYKLERGDITFTNPVKIEPVLDLAASTRVRDYDIGIRFYGAADKPDGLKVTYTSEPPLPQADIIALLALGRTQEESAQSGASQSAFTQEASSALLGQAINATVSSRVQKLFGVSRIKIDPQAPGTATTTSRGPQVTIEQQVSNRLTLTYIQDVAQATQQTIQGEMNVTRNVSLVAVRDQNGVFAFDIRVRQRKK